MSHPGRGGVEVRLVDLPLALQARAEERQADLLREFSHIANADDGAHTPRRLLALAEAARGAHTPLTGAARERVLAARAEGRELVDVVLHLEHDELAAIAAYAAGLEAADEFCCSGDLLTLAAPPELVAYRRWLFGECKRQPAGEAPLPWTAYRDRGVHAAGASRS